MSSHSRSEQRNQEKMANAVSSKKSRNILRTRQTFYKRVQHENEPFTTFLNDLKHLIKHCHFKNCEESILRDRVIFGLHNAKLREEFIENGGDPKLEHIVGVCQFLERQREEQPSGSNAEVMARDGSENDFGELENTLISMPKSARTVNFHAFGM